MKTPSLLFITLFAVLSLFLTSCTKDSNEKFVEDLSPSAIKFVHSDTVSGGSFHYKYTMCKYANSSYQDPNTKVITTLVMKRIVFSNQVKPIGGWIHFSEMEKYFTFHCSDPYSSDCTFGNDSVATNLSTDMYITIDSLRKI